MQYELMNNFRKNFQEKFSEEFMEESQRKFLMNIVEIPAKTLK